MQKKLTVLFAFAIFVLVAGMQTHSYADHKPKHNPGGGGGGGGGGLGGMGSGGITITGPVTVVANSPEEFMRQLDKMARRRGAARVGMSAGIGATPFGTRGGF